MSKANQVKTLSTELIVFIVGKQVSNETALLGLLDAAVRVLQGANSQLTVTAASDIIIETVNKLKAIQKP